MTPTDYAAAEPQWREMLEAAALRAGIPREAWQPWCAMAFADGVSFNDGNPIAGAHYPTIGAAVRVILSDEDAVVSWVDRERGLGGDVIEFVVCAAPSRIEEAGAIIERWLRERI